MTFSWKAKSTNVNHDTSIMFTGLIQDVGKIVQVTKMEGGLRLEVRSSSLAPQLTVSDSVAMNGVCQTVVRQQSETFEVVAVEETLKKTTFGDLRMADSVNLELPLRWNDRLGGHLVLGHVDTVATILDIQKLHESTMYELSVPPAFLQYIVFTGSVALDGVSLTVAELLEASFRVAIIPHTMAKTIFPLYRSGSKVNIEFDVIGKYIERMMSLRVHQNPSARKADFSIEDLRESGF